MTRGEPPFQLAVGALERSDQDLVIRCSPVR
jgi:hypothetical protein